MSNFEKAYLEILNEQTQIQEDIVDTENFFCELYDLYEVNSLELSEDEFFDEIADIYIDTEELNESLTLTQRRKKSRRMRRLARTPRMKMAKERKLRKSKSFGEWTERAKKGLRRKFKTKLLMKRFGKTTETATAKDKDKVEKILSTPRFLQKMKIKVRSYIKVLRNREKDLKSNKSMDSAAKKGNNLLPKQGN